MKYFQGMSKVALVYGIQRIYHATKLDFLVFYSRPHCTQKKLTSIVLLLSLVEDFHWIPDFDQKWKRVAMVTNINNTFPLIHVVSFMQQAPGVTMQHRVYYTLGKFNSMINMKAINSKHKWVHVGLKKRIGDLNNPTCPRCELCLFLVLWYLYTSPPWFDPLPDFKQVRN